MLHIPQPPSLESKSNKIGDKGPKTVALVLLWNSEKNSSHLHSEIKPPAALFNRAVA
jgi:hypothetical protein